MSGFSVRKPYTIFVGVIIIIILGVISFNNLTTDLLPSMELPYVAIITTYPGANPEKVEESVSKVIEQGMMGITNIENVTSTSAENYSMVMLEFSGDSNMDSIMIEISQELDVLKSSLEDGVQTPIVMQLNPDMMPVLMSAVDIKDADNSQITEFVEETLIPELESVSGVASVTTYGSIKNEIKIKLNQSKIDSINDQMLENVSSELYKTKKDLDKAQGEITSGKTELKETKTEKTREIADGLSAIESGRNEITKAEVELNSQNGELNSKNEELKKNLTEIEGTEKELITQKQQIEQGLYVFNNQVNELETQKNILTTKESELLAKRDKGEITGLEIIELNKVQNNINSINSSINSIKSNQTYISLTSGLEKINKSYKELLSGKEQLVSGLSQINSGLTQMNEAQNDINIKKSELEKTSSRIANGTKYVD